MANPTDSAEAMPEHWSWFDLFMPESVTHAIEKVGGSLTSDGSTIMGSTHIDPSAVYGFGFVLLLLTFFGVLFVKPKLQDIKNSLIPEDKLTVSTFFELVVGGVYDQMASMMGREAAKFFLPLLGTCAVVILVSNLMGLVPGFIPPTSNLNVTVVLAVIIFFATHIFGIKKQGPVHYGMHFLGPAFPVFGIKFPWLFFLMLPIEIISHIVRPITLALRLAANMTADHMVLAVFLGLAATLLHWMAPIALPFYFLGIIVCVVQTLVFCLLSMVYISMAIAEEEH